ncbi:A/G-specific adenine glycosylase [Novipirellula aureliae]|uniref:Adenine DNA glycosylase n=1 Tax=Novipirellula aureliae TaxID=2527966 RepID=A0A5C6E3X7_9BACT|nr:A/G-specific adenine glycosylase [Novipirellula aureliae]TWU43395.1 A/G-specific adenine glycosylase [Novipirellula aureliae]
MSEPKHAAVSNEPVLHDPRWNDARWRSRLRVRLIKWFTMHARALPWRTPVGEPLNDPYRVWISEIMLQQTQVATVTAYYKKFMKFYPKVEQLAAAEETALMSQWEGLGYYRRARSMHAAAKQICEKHGGVFPTTYEDVINLPGIGRYTAGAILSISQNQKVPILEGNTQRVFSRWAAVRGRLGEKGTTRLLWDIAEAMLPPSRQQQLATGPAVFNQAAMELGALVCTPRNPNCDECPVQTLCSAYKLGLQEQIPGKVKNIKYEDRLEFAFVIANETGDRYLVRPIPKPERWAGLWDFPRVTNGKFESVAAAADFLGQELSGVVTPATSVATIKHAVTKYRIRLEVFSATLSCKAKGRWKADHPWSFVTADELRDLPMSATGRKIADGIA